MLERGRAADVAFVSVGTLRPAATNRRIGLLEPGDAAELEALGAVGDLLCTFLDAEARPVDHPLNRCAVGLPVADLKQIGSAVRAALIGGYVNHLITDERTGEALTARIRSRARPARRDE